MEISTLDFLAQPVVQDGTFAFGETVEEQEVARSTLSTELRSPYKFLEVASGARAG